MNIPWNEHNTNLYKWREKKIWSATLRRNISPACFLFKGTVRRFYMRNRLYLRNTVYFKLFFLIFFYPCSRYGRFNSVTDWSKWSHNNINGVIGPIRETITSTVAVTVIEKNLTEFLSWRQFRGPPCIFVNSPFKE